MDNSSKNPLIYFQLFIDLLVMVALSLAILATKFHSFLLATISAILLAYSTITAHNFFHMKDNWRMYYFNLSLMSYRDWRIMHAMSHHLFPNTYHDMEISLPEPYIDFLPREKSFAQRFISWIYSPIFFTIFSFSSFAYRFVSIINLNKI